MVQREGETMGGRAENWMVPPVLLSFSHKVGPVDLLSPMSDRDGTVTTGKLPLTALYIRGPLRAHADA